jgi:PAS domain S-box-containing protein
VPENEEHIPELARLREISERLISPELAVQLIDTAPDAWVVVNEDGRIVLFNQRAVLLFGYVRGEVIGQPVEMLIPEAKRVVHVGHRTRYMDSPQVRPMGRDYDLEARHKSGKSIPVLINLAPVVISEGTFISAAIRRKGA